MTLFIRLFIGQTYIDCHLSLYRPHPTGDGSMWRQPMFSFGGNAVTTAAFFCSKLASVPDHIVCGQHWGGLGRIFHFHNKDHGARHIGRNLDPPSQGQFLLRCPSSCRRTATRRALSATRAYPPPAFEPRRAAARCMSDGPADAAITLRHTCREAGILTSLDGGGLRTNNPRTAGIHRRRHRRSSGCAARCGTISRRSREKVLLDYLRAAVPGRRHHHGRARLPLL